MALSEGTWGSSLKLSSLEWSVGWTDVQQQRGGVVTKKEEDINFLLDPSSASQNVRLLAIGRLLAATLVAVLFCVDPLGQLMKRSCGLIIV